MLFLFLLFLSSFSIVVAIVDCVLYLQHAHTHTRTQNRQNLRRLNLVFVFVLCFVVLFWSYGDKLASSNEIISSTPQSFFIFTMHSKFFFVFFSFVVVVVVVEITMSENKKNIRCFSFALYFFFLRTDLQHVQSDSLVFVPSLSLDTYIFALA